MDDQRAVCGQHGVPFFPSLAEENVGIAKNVRHGAMPIHGPRLQPESGTTGWFIWAGEVMSHEPDFFVPLHVSHLDNWCPQVVKFLGLPPGWRFLVAGEYEDVWEDLNLLTPFPPD